MKPSILITKERGGLALQMEVFSDGLVAYFIDEIQVSRDDFDSIAFQLDGAAVHWNKGVQFGKTPPLGGAL